ncbi:hypothetical protein CUMW_095180, partial [Citrus unshiu]
MNPPPADEALKIGIPHRKMWRLGCKNPTTVFYGEIGSPFMLVQAGEKKKSYHAMKLWTIFSDPTASNA